MSSPEKPNVIERFNADFKFLSNFAGSTFFHDGKKYASVEHAYQAAKCANPDEFEKVRTAISPSQAKKFGKEAMLRDGWDELKVPLMKTFLDIKFTNPFYRFKLIETGKAIIIEGNTWHDTFWGVCNCPKHNGEGQNLLGKLLMAVRDEIITEDVQEALAQDKTKQDNTNGLQFPDGQESSSRSRNS